jgi:hypothetical protein
MAADWDKDLWIQRQAHGIIPSLPEDPEEAIQVLEYAKKYVAEMAEPRRKARMHSLRVVEKEEPGA